MERASATTQETAEDPWGAASVAATEERPAPQCGNRHGRGRRWPPNHVRRPASAGACVQRTALSTNGRGPRKQVPAAQESFLTITSKASMRAHQGGGPRHQGGGGGGTRAVQSPAPEPSGQCSLEDNRPHRSPFCEILQRPHPRWHKTASPAAWGCGEGVEGAGQEGPFPGEGHVASSDCTQRQHFFG